MRRATPARFRLISHPDVPDDLAALIAHGADAVEAARVTLDDLAHGRVTGKVLGERRVSGNLTGLASVRFDLPGTPTRRLRLVYADVDATTRGVLAIGVREEHAIYRLAVKRFQAPGDLGGGEPAERSSP